MLEEQYSEQQKQIYILKSQIQQLSLQNDADEDKFVIANEITTAESTDFASRFIDYLDEKNAAHFTNEKMIPNIGKSGESLHVGDAIFNYKINELISANQHSDINITAQA